MPRARVGFTLIELTITLVILALGVAVAVPAILKLAEEDDLDRATRKMETLFRVARDSAIHAGAPVTVVMDSVSGLVWLDLKAPVEMITDASLVAEASPFEIPDPRDAGSGTLLDGFRDREPGTSLELPASVRIELARSRAEFTFVPSGAAHADSLVLRSIFGTRVIRLDPWTGDVVVR